MRDTLSLAARDLAGKLIVLLDSQSVGDAVGRNPTGTSQSLLLETGSFATTVTLLTTKKGREASGQWWELTGGSPFRK